MRAAVEGHGCDCTLTPSYIQMGGGAVTLVTADPLEADAAVTRPRHVVARGVVHTLAQLLAAVTKGPRWAFWRSNKCIRGKDGMPK